MARYLEYKETCDTCVYRQWYYCQCLNVGEYFCRLVKSKPDPLAMPTVYLVQPKPTVVIDNPITSIQKGIEL
jgi:hypothetical protein